MDCTGAWCCAFKTALMVYLLFERIQYPDVVPGDDKIILPIAETCDVV
jgi:hypothetical protein